MPVLIFVMLASLGAFFMVMFLTALSQDRSDANRGGHTYCTKRKGDARPLLYPLSGVADSHGSLVSTKNIHKAVNYAQNFAPA